MNEQGYRGIVFTNSCRFVFIRGLRLRTKCLSTVSQSPQFCNTRQLAFSRAETGFRHTTARLSAGFASRALNSEAVFGNGNMKQNGSHDPHLTVRNASLSPGMEW